MDPAWRYSFIVLRGVALVCALASMGDLLFYAGAYKASSPLFYSRYLEAVWMLVGLAAYPRTLIRFSRLLALPLVFVGLLAAYNWIWLSQNEVLDVASGEAFLKRLFALVAAAFVVESIVILYKRSKTAAHENGRASR